MRACSQVRSWAAASKRRSGKWGVLIAISGSRLPRWTHAFAGIYGLAPGSRGAEVRLVPLLEHANYIQQGTTAIHQQHVQVEEQVRGLAEKLGRVGDLV